MPSDRCVAAALGPRLDGHEGRISGPLPGHGATVASDWVVCIDAERHPVTVMRAETGYAVTLAGGTHEVALDWRPGRAVFGAMIDGRSFTVQIDRDGIGFRLTHGGAPPAVRGGPPRAAPPPPPMSGREA